MFNKQTVPIQRGNTLTYNFVERRWGVGNIFAQTFLYAKRYWKPLTEINTRRENTLKDYSPPPRAECEVVLL